MAAVGVPSLPTEEEQLQDLVASCYADPLAFVLQCFPWGEPGSPLEQEPGPDDNQREFLEELGKEIRLRGFDGANPTLPILMSEASGHGTGKAHPVSLMLHTPDGLRQWGDLQLGDYVFGSNGQPTRIVALHQRFVRPVYRVTFDDRSSTRVCGEHLWLVKGRNQRRRKSGWITQSTEELRASGTHRANGVGRARQWEIPQQGAIEFLPKKFTIEPYVLGVWLGDGGRENARITSADDEVILRIRVLGEDIWPVSGSYAWRIRGLQVRLRALGILDRYSYQKSVPVEYLEAPSADRAELLRGLLDTDGECSTNGCIIFSSTSRALADDVVWLARSLGGKASIQPTVKKPFFTDPSGVKKAGLPCWRATLQMPSGFTCFYVARKQDRVLRSVEPRYLSRWIHSIEPDGVEECRCITVAADDGLYQANDGIVTHNSALGGMIACFVLSTRPDSIGTVTAGTFTQLKERTWAAIQYWLSMCLTAHWFDIQAHGIYARARPKTWKLVPQTCRPENAQSFAGQHARTSTSWYLNDEASEVPDPIWKTQYGGLTDGEPMMFAWGQLVRNTGEFYRICEGSQSFRWNHRRVDSRTSRFTSKEYIKQLEEDYGIDSDYFRVRVLGYPPAASELQFIDKGRITLARTRRQIALEDEPLIAGFDVSGGGKAWNVIRFRRGLNGEVRAAIRIPGEQDKDRSRRIGLCAELLREQAADKRLAAMFVDSAFGAPIVVRLQSLGFTNVYEVNFGAESPDTHQANMRAYMHAKCKEWLTHGSLPDEDVLCDQLCLAGYHINRSGKLVIESKADIQKRGEVSPDDADAFMLTFAAPVAAPDPALRAQATAYRPPRSTWG